MDDPVGLQQAGFAAPQGCERRFCDASDALHPGRTAYHTLCGGRPETAAQTIRLMLSGFVDGVRVPERFNEAWLVVLPKGSEDINATGDIARAADVLRPLLLQNTDSKTIAATLAWAMRRIVASGAHASQRGFVASRDLTRNVLEVDTNARAMHRIVDT